MSGISSLKGWDELTADTKAAFVFRVDEGMIAPEILCIGGTASELFFQDKAF
jgi:hypothetical protein